MGKLFGFLFSLLLVAGLLLGAAGFYGQHLYTRAGPETADGQPRIVTIEKGATADSIASTLGEAGVIADPQQMSLVLRAMNKLREVGVLTGHAPVLKAGEYAIDSGASMQEVVALLAKGSSLQYAVVVPEGLTSAAIINILKSGEWRSSVRPDEVIKLTGEAPEVPAEGVLLPGDYMVQRGATIASVVDRMEKAQTKLLDELWDGRSYGQLVAQWEAPASEDPIKTRQEAVILASIVERESGNSDEQPMIAAALINRLIRGIRLQADATIIYGITKGKPIGRALTRKEIVEKTRWNTYAMDGLPETPICNPGANAIRSVLKPDVTKAIYFMADGKGGHLFADNLKEHEANSDAYWALRKANEKAGVNTPAVKAREPASAGAPKSGR